MIDSPSVFESRIHYRWAGAKSNLVLRIAAHLVLVLVILLLVLQVWQYLQMKSQLGNANQLSDSDGTVDLAIGAAKPGAPSVSSRGVSLTGRNLSPEQRRSLNQAIGQLNVPWHGLFAQLEETTPRSVALLSIEPDGKRMIRIQAESKTLDSLLLYAASLQNQGVLGDLMYVKHETSEQDPTKPARLSFQLELKTFEETLARAPQLPAASKGLK